MGTTVIMWKQSWGVWRLPQEGMEASASRAAEKTILGDSKVSFKGSTETSGL